MARDLDAGKLDKVIADIENNEKKLGAQIKEIEQNITSDKIKDRTEIERRKKILAQIKTERVMQDKHRATISLIKAKVGKISAQIEKLRKEGAKLDWEMLGLSKTSGDSLLNNFTKLYSTFMKENEIAKVVMRVDENGIEKVDYENSIYFNDLDPEARAAYVEKQLLTSWMKRSSAMREALPKILGAVQAEEGGAPQSPVSDVLGGGVPSADDFKPPGLFGQQMNQDDTSANPVANQLSQVQGQQTNVPVSNVANQKLVDRLTSYTTTAEGIEKLKTFLKQAQAENNVDMVNHITQIMRQANINP